MQSPDDYDFDDAHHQADLDGIIERLLARRRVDRSRHDDPITIMLDRISDPFKRIEKPSEEPIRPVEPIKPVEKPHKPINRISRDQVKELRAKGFPCARIAEVLGCSEEDIDLHLREITAQERQDVERLRDQGWGWKKIAAELHASRNRLRSMYGEPSTSP